MYRIAALVLSGALLAGTSARAGEPCYGDINGDGQVTVDEILHVVDHALTSCEVDPDADLKALIGRWGFTYTIISTFTDNLRFDSVETILGYRTLVGVSLDDGEAVVVNRLRDLGVDTTYGDFGGMHMGAVGCETYMFDHTTPDTVDGYTGISWRVGDECGDILGVYEMHGVRTSYSAAFAPLVTAAEVKAEEAGSTGTDSAVAEALNHVLAAMQRR